MMADLPEPFGPTSAVKPATSISSTRNKYQSTRMTRRSSIMTCLGNFWLGSVRRLRDVLFQRSERVLADHDRECRAQEECEITIVAFIRNPQEAALPEARQDFMDDAHWRPQAMRPLFI